MCREVDKEKGRKKWKQGKRETIIKETEERLCAERWETDCVLGVLTGPCLSVLSGPAGAPSEELQ